MSRTKDYYDSHATEYFEKTVEGDFDSFRMRFTSYLKENARIIDVGCGSGRDVAAFCKMGYNAEGLDNSKELAALAADKLGINITVEDMSTWKAEQPYDGIWCFASLLHLTDKELESFFSNLEYNLSPGGILFVSVKDGIETGFDEEGRYMRNFNQDELISMITEAGLEVLDIIHTEDAFGRGGFTWLSVIAKKAA